jgi:hypothetical protein
LQFNSTPKNTQTPPTDIERTKTRTRDFPFVVDETN